MNYSHQQSRGVLVMSSVRKWRRSFFCLSFCSAIALSASAHAADLQPEQDFEPLSVNWAGLYAGVFVGGLYGDNDTDTIGTSGFQALGPTIVPGSLDVDGSAVIGGVGLGFNLQSGSFVYGLEGDFGFTNYDESESFTGVAVLGTRLTTTSTSEIDYFSTVRARAGIAPSNDVMLFATGGLAVGRVETSASVVGVDNPALVWQGSDESWETGWTAGLGVEARVADPVTIKLDALYYDLADTSVTATGNAAVRGVGALDGIDYAAESENKGLNIRLGANVAF